jgi:hypothetical protein
MPSADGITMKALNPYLITKLGIQYLFTLIDRAELERTKNSTVERKKALLAAKTALVANQAKLESTVSTSMKHLFLENKKIFDKLAQYRKYLIAEFFSFFPFNPHSETESAIINIKVPNSSTAWPGKYQSYFD